MRRIGWLVGVAWILSMLVGSASAQTPDTLVVADGLERQWFEAWENPDAFEVAWCGYGAIVRGEARIVAHSRVQLVRRDNNTHQAKPCPAGKGGHPMVAFIHTHPGPRQLLEDAAVPDSLKWGAIKYRLQHFGSAFECDPSNRDRSTQSTMGIPVFVVVCSDDTYAWLTVEGARYERAPNVVGDLADDSDWTAPHDGFLVEADSAEAP